MNVLTAETTRCACLDILVSTFFLTALHFIWAVNLLWTSELVLWILIWSIFSFPPGLFSSSDALSGVPWLHLIPSVPNVNLLYSALDVVRGDCAQLRHENQRLHEESLYLRAKTDSLEAKSDELLGLVRHLVTAQRAEAVEQVHLSESGSNHHRNIGGSENHEFHELGGQQPHLSDALQQSAPVAAHIVASRMLDRDALTSAQPDAL